MKVKVTENSHIQYENNEYRAGDVFELENEELALVQIDAGILEEVKPKKKAKAKKDEE